MTRRAVLIARSVIYAILTSLPNGKPARRPSSISRALRFFRLFWLTFRLLRPDLFRALRGIWEIKEENYRASFGAESLHKGDSDRKRIKKETKKDMLIPMADMGFSGSTFFRTSDDAYLVKSVPRAFEHDFFKNELLLPYAEHMQKYPTSLLARITDLLERAHMSIGELLGLAPSHHIVMENILHGQDGTSDAASRRKWESWDLKPMSFFYPERDVAGGALTSAATKSKLADEFEGKIKLTKEHAAQLRVMLERDTDFLAANNAVDYSFFLVRISATNAADPSFQLPAESAIPSWRSGILSSDGKEMYKAAILDFFWAKHTFHAKMMTGLVQGYNLIDEQGPMSITAESNEYRQRFMKMCSELVEIEE
ncbi:SAICAR synthase-like protein [Astrocystis sublimbata]|nr:SAICAR synthase-like protein [Astrocystis sublimbata]